MKARSETTGLSTEVAGSLNSGGRCGESPASTRERGTRYTRGLGRRKGSARNFPRTKVHASTCGYWAEESCLFQVRGDSLEDSKVPIELESKQTTRRF
jgi:hypothetical protein